MQFWVPEDDEVMTPRAIFGAEVKGLPDFWDEGLSLEAQNQLMQKVIERQEAFVRALGSFKGTAQFELRIVCDPDASQYLRLFYLASIENAGDPEMIWRQFHNAFPYDLDFDLHALTGEEVQQVCEQPFRQQMSLTYYEWIRSPLLVTLGAGTANCWVAPELRKDARQTLLRTLLESACPIVIGFTVAPIEIDMKVINIIENWQKLLEKITTTLDLLQTVGGLGELVRQHDYMLKRISGSFIEKITMDRQIGDMLSELIGRNLEKGYTETPRFKLALAKSAAERILQSSTLFRWRVHAAVPSEQIIDPVIGRVITDDLSRNSDGMVVSSYQYYQCEIDIDKLPVNNFRFIRLDTAERSDDDPARLIIDDIGAAALLQLPILPRGGIAGVRSYPMNPFTSWQFEKDTAHKGIEIGEYIDNRNGLGQSRGVSISLDDLTRHALITGSTGSGKSTTSKRLITELHRYGVPYLVIEPVKAEYHDLAFANGIADTPPYPDFFVPGKFDDPIWFNPFYVRKGVSLNTHLSYFTSCFEAAFPLSDLQSMVLRKVLYKVYRDKFEKDKGKSFYIDGSVPLEQDLDDEDLPSLDDLSEVAEDVINDLGYKGDVRDNLKASISFRFRYLKEGVIGSILKHRGTLPSFEKRLESILQKPTIIQLNQIGNKEEKALVMAFILMAMYEYYEHQPNSVSLRHVTLIEEAHVLLENVTRAVKEDSANTRGKAIELFADMLAEIRSRGEGLVIVEQLPSKLIPEAIKNTNLKIMHRLQAREDRDILGAAMNFNERQSRYATILKRGQAIIFHEGLSQPALIQVTPIELQSDMRRAVDEVFSRLGRIIQKNRGIEVLRFKFPLEILNCLKQVREGEKNLEQLFDITGKYLSENSNKKIKSDNIRAIKWFLYRLTRPYQDYFKLIFGE